MRDSKRNDLPLYIVRPQLRAQDASNTALVGRFMENKTSKLAYVDVMRACAILMVIVLHTSQVVQGLSMVTVEITAYGQMGVQLFFVVSAYTLCLSHVRREGESHPVAKFYTRRFFRIAPLYYIAIAFYFSLHITVQLLQHGPILIYRPYTAINILANMFFVHGFYPPANDNIVPGGWSIGTEMAFYAIFPILFRLFHRQYLKGGVIRLWVLVLVGVTLNISFQEILILTTKNVIQNNSFNYYSLLNQLPVFLIGMAVFFTLQSPRSYIFDFHQKMNIIFFVVFTFLSLGLGLGLFWKNISGLVPSIIPVLSGISFIFLLEYLRKVTKLPQLLQRIGQVSYSMYVFHFVFAWTFSSILNKALVNALPPGILLIISIIVTVLLTFYVALISERLVEKNGIRWGKYVIQKLDHHF